MNYWNRNNPRFKENTRIYTGKSITVPDQTMSLRTLVERHARGLPLETNAKTPIYNNGEVTDVSRLDQIDIIEMQRANAQRIKELQNKMAKDEDEKKAAAEKELTEKLEELKILKEKAAREAEAGPRQS